MKTSNQHIILQTNNLSIGYRNKSEETLIAKDINIQIESGALVALIGVNGVGKSTLLRSLSGIQDSLNGKILINGLQKNKLNSLELSTLISVVLTEQPISKNLSVYELIALGRQPYTNWIGTLSEEDKTHINQAIELVNISSLQHKKCYELSDGQLQKTLIARALAQNTPLVILDEPTTHLDIYHQAHVLKLLKDLTQRTNKSILFATHEINLALQLCDKIILMEKDKVSIGTPLELIEKDAFTNLFPTDLIIFDRSSQTFKINT
ncbi:ABC transporter ATP-binding protein [Gillisia sp. M10.2A]|uniref:ABC transporter ATP-binding protein n=1 Tax=Gillisia lutea TaxID=2909668 RepID=A0ABS9EJW3_9FLAO|nr:ABC transporter ATP-binding protein [Gillisia lutea]MCF4101778.1 ABC transporter ATP-binding protein [Gillisia lutea]